jgi:protocatechuate 3,4-dioxygenase beta subunit
LVLWRVTASAEQLPPGVGMAATPPCDPSTKPTPGRTPAGFRPGAPSRTQLAAAGEPGTRLTLTGAVIGLRCGLIAGATVELWQADARGVLDAAGMRLRGTQLTDAQGRYRVESIVPGAATGQAPRVNMRITVPGKATLTTMLFLPAAIAGAANARDRAFDPLLAMTLSERTAAHVTAFFNVILDL